MSDDRRLVEQARAGDLDAFAEIVRSYERRVRGLLVRLLEDPRDVEEATQDTFVQAWRALGRFEGRSTLFTWLYRIAVNEALMRRRRGGPQTEELDETVERNLAQPGERPVETAELRQFLAARIGALPFEYRAPLVLRDLEGLSNAEVAEALGISVAAAKSRLHRARMTIRAELEEWERGD